VAFRGQEMTIICFQGDKGYHLFVARKSDFPDPINPLGRALASSGKWSAASWDDGRHYYVLVSDMPGDLLEKIL